MASRAEVDRHKKAQADIVKLAHKELVGFWETLDHTNAKATSRALQNFLPQLVKAYGEIAGTVAADFYDELRANSNAKGAYKATVAALPSDEQVKASARWAVGPLFAAEPNSRQALLQASQAAQRLILQSGRDTVSGNTKRDPSGPRWARDPGGHSCAFCLMLASRGAVYWSEESAGGMEEWHTNCGCVPIPMFQDDLYPDGYDPDALYQKYSDARAIAGGDTNEILAELRKQQGIS